MASLKTKANLRTHRESFASMINCFNSDFIRAASGFIKKIIL